MIPRAKIFREDHEVAPRLSLFDVTREELFRVVELAVGGRADAVPNDPVTAGGLFSYIFGTRGIREVFLPKGWIKDSTKNIESVIHPRSGIKLIFQNVDLACDEIRFPKAISGKGIASEQLIDVSIAFLFKELEKEHQERLNKTVWFFCVSAIGEDVRAELSLPLGIEGRQFSGFTERIFILKDGDWRPTVIESPKADFSSMSQDYPISISRK
jgi:hypothetical protein